MFQSTQKNYSDTYRQQDKIVDQSGCKVAKLYHNESFNFEWHHKDATVEFDEFD